MLQATFIWKSVTQLKTEDDSKL